MKSRRMRWVGHGAHMGEKINACRVLIGKCEGSNCLEVLGITWRNEMGHKEIG
jgi:hypothetical protein